MTIITSNRIPIPNGASPRPEARPEGKQAHAEIKEKRLNFEVSYYSHSSMKNPIINNEIGFNVRVHTLCVPFSKFPQGIPNDKNARAAKLNKAFHKDIKKSLLNLDQSDVFTSGLFNLRNSGIVIMADDFIVTKSEDKKGYIDLGEGSIIDGGHTYKIISSILEDYESGKINSIPDEYVVFTIITGLNPRLYPEITEGRNTQQKNLAISLSNQRGELEFLKSILDGQPGLPNYTDQVAFYQNAEVDNEDQIIDAAYLLKVLTTCDIIGFPNSDRHPVCAYSSKEKIVERLVDYEKNYHAMKKIGLDLLRLRDFIVVNSASWISSPVQKIFDTKKSNIDNLVFLSGELKQKARLATKLLYDPIAFPVLSSLRQFMEVVDTSEGEMIVWKDGYDYPRICQLLEDGLAENILIKAYNAFKDSPTGNSINAVVKHKYIWSETYSTVSDFLLKK